MTNKPSYKELEQKVRELEEKVVLFKKEQTFQDLAENSPDVICRLDRELRHTYVNKAVESVIGGPASSLIGKTHKDLPLPENICLLCEQKIVEVFETRKEQIFEFSLPSPAGTVYIQSHLVPEFSESGEVETVLCISRDITDLKNAENSLRQSEQKLKKITESIPGGIFQYQMFPDGTYRFLFMTRRAEELYGIPAKRIEEDADLAWNAILPDDLTGARESLRVSAESLTTCEFNFRICTPADKIKWIHGCAIPELIQEDGSIVWTGLLVDISERKQIEQEKANLENQLRQSQKMEAVGTLAAGIAHDFNNILNIIAGAVEYTKAIAPQGGQIFENMQIISDSGDRAASLVRQILTFSRQTEQIKQPLSLQPLIKELIAAHQETTPASIEIHQKIDPECGAISADPAQMHQVVTNLVVNALQAMEKHGGMLEIGLQEEVIGLENARHADMKPGKYAHFRVSDTGPGMN